MKKFRLYYDKDKEEKWLNRMCEKGWAMTGFFMGVYTFESCEKSEYIYRIDMPGEIGKSSIRDGKAREYISFVEETGAEYVCTWGWWVIFRKKASAGNFELYTDTESQIALYRRIQKLFLWGGLLEIIMGINNTLIYLSKNRIDAFDIAMLVLIYLLMAVFLVGIIKTTIKIKKLKEKSLLTK